MKIAPGEKCGVVVLYAPQEETQNLDLFILVSIVIKRRRSPFINPLGMRGDYLEPK